MIVVSLLAAWLPPPPPLPWQPTRAPGYAAACYATDVAGVRWSGKLDVAGQGDARVLSLRLGEGQGKSLIRGGKSVLMVTQRVTDGTYGFTETLSFDNGAQPLAVELAGLGPAPSTLKLTVRDPAKSPAFDEPAMVGLCQTTSIQEGSRFVPEPAIEERSR